jgi:DMATS type aromatic prenyltransferase
MAFRESVGHFEHAPQRDFGALVERRPREVVHARSEQDVVEAVARARRLKIGVVARGQGHTTRGQSLVDGGISLATSELDDVRIEGETAVVGAGALWDSVVRAAWAHGLAPPVLTDYLGLSVGGTLSVGGVGGASFRHGLQTDQVLELRVVTGRGDVRTCSAQQDRELFDACRAGLGQVAIIVAARLRLSPAPARVRVARITHDALAPFLEDQSRLAEEGWFDELRGSVLPRNRERRFVIEATQYMTEFAAPVPLSKLEASPAQVAFEECDFFDYVTRLRALERDMRVTGLWHAHHPWFDVFVPGSCANDLIDYALDGLEQRGLESSHLMVYPLRRGPCRTPLLPVPTDPFAFLFDVLPDERRRDDLPQWDAYARSVFELAAARGARMYPIGYPVGTTDIDWHQHYGPSWPALSKAIAAHDPDGLFSRKEGAEAPRRATSTLGEIATERLTVLGQTTGSLSHASRLVEFGETMSGGWWSERVSGPAWASDLTDDGTPFELSVAIGSAAPELRLLVEPRPVDRDPAASFAAAMQVGRALRDAYSADLSALEEIAALFGPVPGSMPRFLVWYAVHMTSAGPLFKVYLNPEVRGPEVARESTRTALERLGLPSAWTFLEERLGPSTRIPYVSIDLCERARARTKVYLAHSGGRPEDVERVAAGSSNHRTGELARWIQALASADTDREERPILTCHAFGRGTPAPEVTLHIPIRCHVRDDRDALTLARALCRGEGAESLDRVVRALAQRPLEAARGMITYLSLRGSGEGPRVTTYLAPQVRRLTPVRQPKCARVGDIRRAIEVAQTRYATHPFFARIELSGSRDDVRVVARRLAFFIMCFQDMGRIACERSRDPEMARALRQHRREDMGHEHWYLADLLRLGLSSDIGVVFQPEDAVVRDVSYALVSLIFQARTDVALLAIVLALEGAAHEFFGRFVPLVQRAIPGQGFTFFGRSHLQAEAEHEMATWAALFERPIDRDETHEMADAVQETFRQMTQLAQDMEDALARAVAPSLVAEAEQATAEWGELGQRAE